MREWFIWEIPWFKHRFALAVMSVHRKIPQLASLQGMLTMTSWRQGIPVLLSNRFPIRQTCHPIGTLKNIVQTQIETWKSGSRGKLLDCPQPWNFLLIARNLPSIIRVHGLSLLNPLAFPAMLIFNNQVGEATRITIPAGNQVHFHSIHGPASCYQRHLLFRAKTSKWPHFTRIF